MTDDINRLNEILYSGLSNDIAGPVNVILNAAEYLEKQFCDQPELVEVVHKIRDNGRYLDRLGAHLVELAACFTDTAPKLGTVELREQICFLLEETAPYAARQRVTLFWEPDRMPVLHQECNAVMVDGILLKLLSVLIQYSRPGGTVALEVVDREGQPPQIRIRNDGPGIPPRLLSAVFSACPSGEHQGMVSAGAGLGLYLANEFCRMMGWRLSVEPVREGGTAAVIELCPCGRDPFGRIELRTNEVGQSIFRYEQRERVRREMAPLLVLSAGAAEQGSK